MIKQKLQSAWNWTKEKAKRFWKWGIAIVIGGVVLAAVISPAEIPEEYKLKCPKEKVLVHKNIKDEEGSDMVRYRCISEIEVPVLEGEDISKRTKNAQFFPQKNGEMMGHFYIGEPFYKDITENKWYRTTIDITTPEAFEEQMKIGWINKLLGEKVLANDYDVGSGSGAVYKGANISWNTTHDATTGSGTVTFGLRVNVNTNSSNYYTIHRVFAPVNTSALDDGCFVTDATWNVYGESLTNEDDDGDDFIRIVHTDQPDPTTRTTADYNNCGATNNPEAGANDIDFGSLNGADWNVFTLNDAGKSWVSVDGYTLLGMREGHDVIDSVFAGPNKTNSFRGQGDEDTNPAYLSVTCGVAAERRIIIIE